MKRNLFLLLIMFLPVVFASGRNTNTMKTTFTFHSLLWFGSTLWAVSDYFIDSETTIKWYCAFWGAVIGSWICFFHHICHPNAPYFSHKRTFAFIIFTCTVSQALYGIWQILCLSTSSVTGSFDNPAGLSSLLALALPFGCHVAASTSNKQMRLFARCGIAILCTALLLTESRAGIFSALFILFLHYRKRIFLHRKVLGILSTSVLIVLSITLYLYKKDSADGRLLIWQCSIEMIGDRPWQGYGIDGFRRHYMNYQATYFQQHPNSRYAILADDIKHPFNEYLYLLIHYGTIGGIVLTAAIISLIHSWRKHPGGTSRPAILCLTAAAVFSLFSYPFRYPHTWILCIYSSCLLLGNAYRPVLATRKILLFASTFAFSILSVFAFKRMRAEIKWTDTADRSLCGMTMEMLPIYKDLYHELHQDPLFLYNYAAELNVAGQYKESLCIGKECESRLADYFTQLLLADNCRHLHKYEEAIYHLTQASYMCPNRFVPLYELYKIYKIQHDTAAMHNIGQAILTKPVKIESPEIRRIIFQVNKDLREVYK